MPLGFYIAGVAGQMAQHKLNDISHNLANVNTTGYMASHASFATQLSGRMAGVSAQAPAAFTRFNNQFTDMQKGNIKKTGNDFDFAIRGHGFFRVRLADGAEAYTRAGNFKLDGSGTLLTRTGHPVLDTTGSSIQIPSGHITADQEGALFADGTRVAQLGIVQIQDASKIIRIGSSLLKTPVSNTISGAPDITVHQGMLESSNVNAILAMAELIDTMRSYQATMKIVEQFNQQEALLSDKVGHIQG